MLILSVIGGALLRWAYLQARRNAHELNKKQESNRQFRQMSAELA